jgi:hypothetical protein
MAHREMIENSTTVADPNSHTRTSFLGITSPLTRPYVEDKPIANVLLNLIALKRTVAFNVDSFYVSCPSLGGQCTLHSPETAFFLRTIMQINEPVNYQTTLIIYYKTIKIMCSPRVCSSSRSSCNTQSRPSGSSWAR